MRITTASRQEAGECADALRKILDGQDDVLDEDGDPILSVTDRIRLRDLLTALEDAERGTPARTEVPGGVR